MLLMLIALLTGGLFIATLRGMSWRLPLIASGLWLVVLIAGALVYPAVVQSLVVNPNQQSREAPFITRNVIATREAMGIPLERVEKREVELSRLTSDDVAADLEPLQDVRLLNPAEMISRFRIDQGQEAGLRIVDLDVDRYELEGERQQVLVAGAGARCRREPEPELAGTSSHQHPRVRVDHGAGRAGAGESPRLSAGSSRTARAVLQPQPGGYAVAATSESERACDDGDGPYSGTAGVEISSFTRRAAFTLAFLDYNVLGSGAIEDGSQMLWVRNVRDRLTKLAPFLSYDGDPYPVVVEGRVKWVVDAYTSSSRYPYGQRIGNDIQLTPDSGLSRDANYVRNSVKAVVDTYDGAVQFYVVDPTDPIVQAWQGAFDDLFTPAEQMPAELEEHLRYPEDLFRVQTDVYSKYQLPPADFFARVGGVVGRPGAGDRSPGAGVRSEPLTTDVADEPAPAELATESQTSRFIPYYTLFRNDETGEEEFVLLRPFVPFSRNDERTELQAYMTASSDPESYGQLIAYVVTGDQPDGPRTVANRIDAEPSISQQVNFQTGGGNTVHYGDLQLVPVGDGLIYVRPFYALVPQGADTRATVAEYRFVIASHAGRATIGETMGEALGELFPGFDEDLGDRVGTDAEPGEAGTEPTTPPEGAARPTPPPRSCWPEPAGCSAEADDRAPRRRPRRVPGPRRRGRRPDRPGPRPARRPAPGPPLGGPPLNCPIPRLDGNRVNPRPWRIVPPHHARPTSLTPGGQPGRRSCSARRARSSRNAIW